MKDNEEPRRKAYTTIALSVLSLFANVVATGGVYWIQRSIDEENIGLWMICRKGVCMNLDQRDQWLQLCRGNLIAACGLILICNILMIIYFLRHKKGTKLIHSLLFIAAILSLTAMVVYTLQHFLNGMSKFGWSYYFGWLGFSLIVLSLTMMCMNWEDQMSISDTFNFRSCTCYSWIQCSIRPHYCLNRLTQYDDKTLVQVFPPLGRISKMLWRPLWSRYKILMGFQSEKTLYPIFCMKDGLQNFGGEWSECLRNIS